MAKMGRPPSDKPKRNDTRVRMTDDDVEKLNYTAEVLGLTKAEVIRQGINKMYKQAQETQKK